MRLWWVNVNGFYSQLKSVGLDEVKDLVDPDDDAPVLVMDMVYTRAALTTRRIAPVMKREILERHLISGLEPISDTQRARRAPSRRRSLTDQTPAGSTA